MGVARLCNPAEYYDQQWKRLLGVGGREIDDGCGQSDFRGMAGIETTVMPLEGAGK